MNKIEDFETLDWEDEDPITAQNNFTDRDEFRKALTEAVETPQPITERRVKVFYGAGGQGKSALKNDFFIKKYLLEKQDENIIFSDKVDFEDQPKTRLVDEALLRIAEDLIVKGHIPLPAFCLGFLRYKMQTSAEKNIQQDYPFLYKIKFIGNDIANELANTIISSAIDLIATGSQMIPGVSFFAKKIAEKSHQKIVEWIQRSDAKKVLGDIDELNSLQLLQRLPLLLAYDINKYLKKNISLETGSPSKKIIIIFDGYETLWRDEINPDVDKDAWVRTLVEKMPGVLFVLFGRDKINWAEKNEAFNKILDQHLLKGLSDQDADKFLQLSEIVEEDVRKQIIKSSKNTFIPEDGCLPFYLDIQIKTYKKIKKLGNVPVEQDFYKNDEDVIKHFFEHLHPEVAGAIKSLSLAPYIDEEIIELYLSNNFISSHIISLRSLSRHSFIRFDGKKAIIHGLMKDMAINQFKNEFRLRYKKINEKLFTYFEDKLPVKQQELNAEVEGLLAYASYYKQILSKKEFVNWAWKKATFFYGKDIYGSLTNILNRALACFFQEKQNELHKDTITLDDVTISEIHSVSEINYYLALRNNWIDDYQEAESKIKECLKLIDFILSKDNLQQILSTDQDNKNEYFEVLRLKKNAFELYASVLESMDRYVEAGDYYHKAFTIANDYKFEYDYNAHALYLSSVGRFAEAEPRLFETYQYWKNQLDNKIIKEVDVEEQVALAAHNLAKTLRGQGRYDEAIKYHKEAIKIYEKVRTTSHEYYAIVKASLAITLVNEGFQLDEAEKIYNEVFEIYRKKYNEDHLAFGYYYTDLGSLYAAKEDLSKAEFYFNKGTQILSKLIGSTCRAVLEAQLEQAILIDKLYQDNKVSKEVRQGIIKALVIPFKYNLDLLKNRFSIYNPLFHKAIELVVHLLSSENDREVASILEREKQEFIRITNQRTAIRHNHFHSEPLVENKNKLLSSFHSIMSLPDDNSKIDLLKIKLPFYQDFNLYEITYNNTVLPTHRYVLSDGEGSYLIDYKNDSIYNVSEKDGHFNINTCFDYLTFLFDSVCGRLGFFYTLPHPSDMPWCVNTLTTEQAKKSIISKLSPFKVVEDGEEKIVVELFILFHNSLFKSNAVIYKKDILNKEDNSIVYHKGNCQLNGEMLCVFRENGDIIYRKELVNEDSNAQEVYVDDENNIVSLQPNEKLMHEISACIDPTYTNQEKKFEEKSFPEKLITGLEICRNYTELILVFNDEENKDYYTELNFKALDLLNRMSRKQKCTYTELIDLFVKVNNVIFEMIDAFKHEEDTFNDWRIKSFEDSAYTLKLLVDELDDMYRKQQPA